MQKGICASGWSDQNKLGVDLSRFVKQIIVYMCLPHSPSEEITQRPDEAEEEEESMQPSKSMDLQQKSVEDQQMFVEAWIITA